MTEGREKPMWLFSAYGPAKGEPNMVTQLEESAEEFRVKFMQAQMSNNLEQYVRCHLSPCLIEADSFH